jgi:hypothetical protein
MNNTTKSTRPLLPPTLLCMCLLFCGGTALHAQEVWIAVQTQPPDQSNFNLQVDGSNVALDISNGATAGPYIQSPGKHTVTEKAGTGTNIANYTLKFGGDCADDGQGHGVVTVAASDRKTCLVTNLGPPVLSVSVFQAEQPPPGDAGMFNLLIDGAPVGSPVSLADENSVATFRGKQVPPGAYTVGQSAVLPGTNPANYVTFIGGNCTPDGKVNIAVGEFEDCSVVDVAPATSITFQISTTDDDPRGDSAVTADLFLANQSVPAQSFTLKKKGDPAWGTDSNKTFTFPLSPPLQDTDIGSININLVQGGSWPETDDHWHINVVSISAADNPCLFSRTFNPDLDLNGANPTLALAPDQPVDLCIKEITPPSFSPPSGLYKCPQQVTMSPSVTGSIPETIFFTTDSSRPTGHSQQYTGPVTIAGDGTEEIISALEDTGLGFSRVVTASYFCQKSPPPDPCPTGQQCCTGVSANGSCNTACVPSTTSCQPLCPRGLVCCGGASPTGKCDDRCVKNRDSC